VACMIHSSTLTTPSQQTTTAAMHLLLIEDDLQAAEYLVKGLHESGYDVAHSADGRDAPTVATACSKPRKAAMTSSLPTASYRMWTACPSSVRCARRAIAHRC
jgi:hypothetical protein